ncbi:hypothetical protein VNO80_22974 [Phaseolus coccineus]|uniref:Uncharacterized protein n=1 Tax=Phaseolus coccineus TaxID=3886 RepID=A0AAN9MAW7_PHACN
MNPSPTIWLSYMNLDFLYVSLASKLSNSLIMSPCSPSNVTPNSLPNSHIGKEFEKYSLSQNSLLQFDMAELVKIPFEFPHDNLDRRSTFERLASDIVFIDSQLLDSPLKNLLLHR